MKRVLIVSLIVGLLITLFPPVAIAAPSLATLSQEPPPCNPRATFLSKWMGVECSVLMDYQADGVGFGVIMKAYFLSQIPGFPNWESLLGLHQQDVGWGQIMKAYFLASVLEVDAEELLEMHKGGIGWGEILKEQGLGPGKPPWAHGGKPPWAGPHKPTE